MATIASSSKRPGPDLELGTEAEGEAGNVVRLLGTPSEFDCCRDDTTDQVGGSAPAARIERGFEAGGAELFIVRVEGLGDPVGEQEQCVARAKDGLIDAIGHVRVQPEGDPG